MRFLSSPAVAAIALAVLVWLGPIGPLINSNHLWAYHFDGDPAVVFVPVLINLALTWAVLAGTLFAARSSIAAARVIWPGVVCLTPWLMLQDGAILAAWAPPRWAMPGGLALCVAAWAVWSAMLCRRPESWTEELRERAGSAFGVAGLGGLALVVQVLWCFREARAIRMQPSLHAAAASAAATRSHGRIIWLVLDELSYEQLYERRAAGLTLPEFDRLAAQATVFTHVIPTAERTQIAIPSMLSGVAADQVRASADGMRLEMHSIDMHDWEALRPENTLFQDALGHGYRTAVAGWYNPYCRTLAPVLDRCEWAFHEELTGGMASRDSIAQNTLGRWRLLWFHMHPGQFRTVPPRTVEERISDYQRLTEWGDAMLADESLDFVFLHMPVPHQPGFYNRRLRKFVTEGASYLDNLALADEYLGHVRAELEARGDWDSSTVVVMGDHSWRTTLLWRGGPYWTPEDERISPAGHFDDRPAYVVKIPDQREQMRVEAPFRAVETRRLLDGVMDGTIRTPADVAGFAAQRAQAAR